MQKHRVTESEDYKETELGLLPKEWSISRLGDVCNLVMGQSPAGETYNKDGKGMPFLQGKAEFGAVYPEHIKFTTHPLKIAKKGSVLLSVRAPVGNVNIANIDYCIGRGLASLSLNNENNRFLFYLLTYFKSSIEREGSGSTFKAISKPNLKTIAIPLPPLPEQQNIAFVLSTVQDAQQSTERAINSLKELKKSLMKHLFTYGAVSFEDADKVKLKETEIGQVPEGWEVSKIGNIFKIQQGKQLSSKEGKEGKLKKPFLRTANVFWGNVNLSTLDSMYFTEKEIEKLRLKENDILVCEGGDVGRTALWKAEVPECFYQNHLHRLRPVADNYDPLFFVLWMEHAITHQGNYIQAANRTTIPNLSASRLREFVIPLPSLSEQQQIASILATVDEKIGAEEQRKEALTTLFNSQLKNLMTAKIRVNDLKV